jgi:pimeloyl-ACP methyl ester carboxylesterase
MLRSARAATQHTQRSIATLATLTLLLAAALSACAVGSSTSSAPAIASETVLTTECLIEPVFAQRACIYETGRDKPRAVLLVHGINGDGRTDWRAQIPALAEEFHVIVVDLPGFGQSDRGNDLYSVENYARFLQFVVARYAKGRVSLVGHSLGGAVVLWYSQIDAVRVDRVVVVGVAGILHRLTLANRAAGGGMSDLFGTTGERAEAYLRRLAGKVLEEFERVPMDADAVLNDPQKRAEHFRGDPARIAGFALATTDFTSILPAVSAPTLLIWGEHDKVAPIRTAQVLIARLPHARLATLPAGHSPMRETPEHFNSLMLSHLRGDTAGLPALTPQKMALPDNLRHGLCERQRGVLFEGEYDTIRIHHCAAAVLREVRARHIDVVESTIEIQNSVIEGDGVAVELIGSELTATATDISGEIAIKAARSRLDLAAVRIQGRSAAIIAPQASNIIFSVSTLASPHRNGPVHTFLRVGPGSPL